MKFLTRLFLQRAIVKGSGRFATLGAVFALLRLIRKLSGGEEHTMYKHTLREGDVVVIREPKQQR